MILRSLSIRTKIELYNTHRNKQNNMKEYYIFHIITTKLLLWKPEILLARK